MWAKDFECCVVCGRNDLPHTSAGRCRRCYQVWYRKNNQDKIRASKKAWYEAHPGFFKKQREHWYYDDQREPVLVRDGRVCHACGSKDQLVVHHLDGRGRGEAEPNNSPDNLQVLCRSCHQRVHRTLARWSVKYDRCLACGTVDEPHNARGLCRRCYTKWNASQSAKGR